MRPFFYFWKKLWNSLEDTERIRGNRKYIEVDPIKVESDTKK